MLDPCRVLFSTPLTVKNQIEKIALENNASIEFAYKSVDMSFCELMEQASFDISVIYCKPGQYDALMAQISSAKQRSEPLFDRFILTYDELCEPDLSLAWSLGMCSAVSSESVQNLYHCLESYATLIASNHKSARDMKEASDIALLSMSSGSEMGEVIRFLRRTFECESFESLSSVTDQTLVKMGFDAYGLLRAENSWVYFGNKEEETVWHRLIRHFRQAERFIDLPSKTVVNFSHISILARDMPDPSTEDYGRKKELLFMLAEGVNARAIAIGHELQIWESDQARNVFMSLVSHELRTPMNAILGFSHYLNKKNTGHELTSRDIDALGQLDEKSSELLTLISSLLEISDIQSEQKVASKRSILRDVLFQVLLDSEKKAIENGLDFIVIWPEDEIIMKTDMRRLKHILAQLLSNAIKFTCVGGITVELSLDDEIVEVTVSDTGVGIDDELQKRLFTPFSQLHANVSNHHAGLGIGLAIVSQFCKDLQGDIHLQSEPGVGSCFRVRLPLVLIHYEDQVFVSNDESELF